MWKLLTRLRYVRETEIRSSLVTLHGILAKDLALKVAGRVPRIHDALVSYLDGPGKSGSQYAKIYGEENRIFHERIVEPTQIDKIVAMTLLSGPESLLMTFLVLEALRFRTSRLMRRH